MIVSNNNPTITWHLRQYITLTPDTGHRKRVQASSYGVPGYKPRNFFGPHPRIRVLTPIAGCKHLLSLYADWPFIPDACIYATANHH